MTAPLPPLPAWLGECRRYMDDAPGVRAECERNKGKCYDCPNKRREEISALLKLAVREALERARKECAAARIDYPITGALYNGRCEDRIDAMIEEYK